jgi:flavodoxin
MKTRIIYDSGFGNTEKVAQAIGKGLKAAQIVKASEATISNIKGLDLLIVGSPTYGGRPTQALQNFLNQIPAGALQGVSVAAFDTRFQPEKQKKALQLLMKVIGFAAPKIAESLKKKGGELLAPPEGFIVLGKEGPLAEGEQERAAKWADSLKI